MHCNFLKNFHWVEDIYTCMEETDNNMHNLSDTKLSSLQSRLDDWMIYILLVFLFYDIKCLSQ